MRKIILLLLCQYIITAFAQDCGIDTWIKDNYIEDAKILALREIYYTPDHVYKDSVIIPTLLTDKYISALSAVFLMNTGATDTIFSVYTIHAFPNIPMTISMLVDTNYFSVQHFLRDSVLSGNPQFDTIMVEYGFRLELVMNLSSGLLIYITTPDYINLYPLVDSLRQINGLKTVEARETWAGDGPNIEFSSSNDTTFMKFSIGWEDCFAGCI